MSLPCLAVGPPHRKKPRFPHRRPFVYPAWPLLPASLGTLPSRSSTLKILPPSLPISTQNAPDSLSLLHAQVTFAEKQSSWGTQPCGLPHDVISLPPDKPEEAKELKVSAGLGEIMSSVSQGGRFREGIWGCERRKRFLTLAEMQVTWNA